MLQCASLDVRQDQGQVALEVFKCTIQYSLDMIRTQSSRLAVSIGDHFTARVMQNSFDLGQAMESKYIHKGNWD